MCKCLVMFGLEDINEWIRYLNCVIMKKFEFKRSKKFFCIRNIRKWKSRSISGNENLN